MQNVKESKKYECYRVYYRIANLSFTSYFVAIDTAEVRRKLYKQWPLATITAIELMEE